MSRQITLFIDLRVLVVVENTSGKPKDVLFLVLLNMEHEKLSLCLNILTLTLYILSPVLQNHEILDFNYNWSQLLFIEAYYIEKHDPVIDHGLKASK